MKTELAVNPCSAQVVVRRADQVLFTRLQRYLGYVQDID